MKPYVLFDISDIPQMTHGHFVNRRYNEGAVFDVIIDSRKAKAGSLFVPIKGEKTDGHLYIEQVLKNGAAGSFVSDDFYRAQAPMLEKLAKQYEKTLFVVPNTLTALQNVAKQYLAGFRSLIRIGVTGSSGKTSTKEMISSVLEEAGSTVKTIGNFNSEIGLPLSVFQVRPDHVYGVFEMGMNWAGEMDILADILRPQIGVITNIGRAHVGELGSVEAIASEKKKIFKFFSGDEYVGFIFENEKYFEFLKRNVNGRIYGYGLSSSTEVQDIHDLGFKGSALVCREGTINLSVSGSHAVSNALCAMQIGSHLGIPFAAVKTGIEKITPSAGRGEVLPGTVTIIQDAYNANPDSMHKAIDHLTVLPWKDGRRIALLGDMKELGKRSRRLHKEIGRYICRSGVDIALFYGDDMEYAFKGADSLFVRLFSGFKGTVLHARGLEAVKQQLGQFLEPGDLLLMKGSRSMELEKLVPFIQGLFDTENREESMC